MAEGKQSNSSPETQKKKDEKKKLPSARKRDLQSQVRRGQNRSYRSAVSTAIRGFEEALSKKELPSAKEKLQAVYSLMDKGVKKGVYKQNKASRTKSRLTSKMNTR